MVKLALLSWLAVAAPVFSAPADVLSPLDTRACTTPANTLKNPGFESSALTPWVFQPTYVKLGSATVVKSGYKSDHAIQAAGTSGYNDPTSYNKLYQTFKICKASRFQLSWSILLPKDSVKYTAPGKPGLYVEAKAPDGLWYQMGSFSFDTKTFSSTIFTPSFKGTHKVDQWANFVADFPNSQTGTWTISMECLFNSEPPRNFDDNPGGAVVILSMSSALSLLPGLPAPSSTASVRLDHPQARPIVKRLLKNARSDGNEPATMPTPHSTTVQRMTFPTWSWLNLVGCGVVSGDVPFPFVSPYVITLTPLSPRSTMSYSVKDLFAIVTGSGSDIGQRTRSSTPQRRMLGRCRNQHAEVQGNLLLVANMGGYMHSMQTPLYFASIAALVSMVKSLSGLERALGFRNAAICPGPAHTPIFEQEYCRDRLQRGDVALEPEHVAELTLKVFKNHSTEKQSVHVREIDLEALYPAVGPLDVGTRAMAEELKFFER
ncbi:hypothetical protein FOXB_16577 [Fusarium oxysporum f. sp. conglutinans Fo5176]|uniref:Peptidase A1 domain-containing protein n=1 Tax=Fusarium oxysporum (strain Fo5176) TaxID=660025 RepID=F9GD43_FUSOF|nr:hypothetical protein FOXB_16577 [Fusarium oxysporum f. sp. conglutinans Fo5176]